MRLIASLLLSVVTFHSLSLLDGPNHTVIVLIHYNNHSDDKIVIDRDEMESDAFMERVENLVEKRTGSPVR